MRTLHIHNLTERIHWLQWQEIKDRIGKAVRDPAFWAIMVMVILFALLIVLAMVQGFEENLSLPMQHNLIYPFPVHMQLL